MPSRKLHPAFCKSFPIHINATCFPPTLSCLGQSEGKSYKCLALHPSEHWMADSTAVPLVVKVNKCLDCCQWDTLCMPWSWQKYCLNHYARMRCSLHIVTRCRFMNWPIRCEWGGRNMHFLSINLISFCQSHGIVLVMASPAREMDSASRQWNAEKDVRNVRDFSVKRLPSGGTRGCMPQQMRYAGVSADWEQKLCTFWSRPNPHRDQPRHCQWASSLVQRLWLARFVSVWEGVPSDVMAQSD